MTKALKFQNGAKYSIIMIILILFMAFNPEYCSGAPFFISGWEDAGSTGCGRQLLDNGKWSDLDWTACNIDASPCWYGAGVVVSNDPTKVHTGIYSMVQNAVDCCPCGGVNGPWAGIEYNFTPVSSFYARFYLKQSPGWRSWSGSTAGNWVIWKVSGDCWWCLSDNGQTCTNYNFSDQWHYVEIHTHTGSGTNGHIQVRVDGIQKYLINPGYGNRCDSNGMTITEQISHVKFDLVQGGGSEQKLLLFGPGNHAFYFMQKPSATNPWQINNQCDFASLISGHQWRAIDDVAFASDNWIGPTGALPSPPPSSPITPPSGFRIVQ